MQTGLARAVFRNLSIQKTLRCYRNNSDQTLLVDFRAYHSFMHLRVHWRFGNNGDRIDCDLRAKLPKSTRIVNNFARKAECSTFSLDQSGYAPAGGNAFYFHERLRATSLRFIRKLE